MQGLSAPSAPGHSRPSPPSRGAGTSVHGRRLGESDGVADRTRLVVVSCSSLAAAERALAEARALEGVRDAAIVTRTERGRVELRQTHQVAAGEGVVAGGTVGFVAGMLLGGPVGGALLGLAGGGLW